MEPTRASGSGEPRERLDSADGEEPEMESLEIIGQEMVPYAGGRRPPRRMVEVVRPLELTATPLKPGQGEEELDPEPPRRWPNGPEGEPEAMKPLFTPEQIREFNKWDEKAPLLRGPRMDQPRPAHLPVESNLEGDTPGGGQLRPRYLPMGNPEPEGQMMKMMAASPAPGVDPVYLMQMMQELMTRNQRLQHEVEVLKKQGKETDADYGTPESREKVNGMSTVRDNQNHEPYGPTRDPRMARAEKADLELVVKKEMLDEQDGGASERASDVAGFGKDGHQIDVMLKLMEGMQMMQKQLLEQKEKKDTIETVKAGFAELPRLGPENGPIDLGDWFTKNHPLMSDLSDSSMEWWDLLLKEAREWYEEYMKEIPLNRVNMVPKTPEVLGLRKWSRLERRAASLIIQAVPETARDEMIATNTVSAYRAICRLLVVYQPGGLGGAQEFEKVAQVEAAGKRDELGVARPHGDDEGPQQDDSESGGDEPGADVPDFPCPEHAAGGQRADAWNGAAVRGACLGRTGTEQPGG